ncbi:gliding motility-associated C-terminal domain-containing protein [Spongiimicrobium sp. 3-5]|uniref:T9SS type B sorting domain-containing protein n=1 Tax=Spongiimicrobium sp. 3-5 TaxID=3332596 RepID=UPI00397F56B5
MKYFLLILLLCPFLTQAQWSQAGQDLLGETIVEVFGSSTSINADGSVVAIGAPSDSGPGTVRVYRRNSVGNWDQVGQDLNGEGGSDISGSAISLSADGSMIAIGAARNDGNGIDSGHVRIFRNISGTWHQIGQDIDGESAGSLFGTWVSLSADGAIVAIGGPGNDGNGIDSGHVKIFRRNALDVWEQLGQDIDGEIGFDQLGIYVSLSADGSTLATSSLSSNDANGFSGVRVFGRTSSDNWEQLGQTLYAERTDIVSGSVTSLSADGSILAIGNSGNSDNGSLAGHTRVFQRNALDIWEQIGEDLDGEAAGDLSGISVSLSEDGSIVAIGAFGNSGNGNAAGHVRVYRNALGTWEQLGEDIDGESESDQSGFSVSINNNGSIVVIGSPGSSKATFLSGRAAVFAFCDLADTPTLSASPQTICPADLATLTINGNLNSADQWYIYSGSCGGTLVGTSANGDFQVNPSTTTTYFVRGEGDGCIGSCNAITITVNAANISCPGDILVQADANSCSATNVTLGTPNTNGCSSLNIINDAPTEFPLGETLVTWTATDTTGNTTICTQKVIVEDNSTFTITCQDNVTVQTDIGGCTATNVVLETPVATTGCSMTAVANDAPTEFPLGETLVTWTATDTSGNVAICTQKVIVEDNSTFTITCPDDVTAQTDIGGCTATNVVLETPAATTGCSMTVVTNDAPTEFPLGETLVTWTATDTSGNTATCVQTVTVEDVQMPMVITRDITVALDAEGLAELTVDDIDNGSSDNCGISDRFLDKSTFNCPPLGTETVTLTITDINGNISTDTAVVTFTAPDENLDGIADMCANETLVLMEPQRGVSPNSDNINDTWLIKNIMDYPQAQIRVFDRKGKEVFRTKNYQNDWGGTHGTDGSLLPVDAYYYAIDAFGDNRTVVSGWLYINY